MPSLDRHPSFRTQRHLVVGDAVPRVAMFAWPLARDIRCKAFQRRGIDQHSKKAARRYRGFRDVIQRSFYQCHEQLGRHPECLGTFKNRRP